MIKTILWIIGIILVLSLVLNGCIGTEKEDTVEGIEKDVQEFENLEKELEDSGISDFEQSLDEIENW